jgi:uncharacterized protein (UPF0333 family)
MASKNKSSARSRKAQSTLEYSICIFAVIVAISAMVVYVKRGISGRYADVVRTAAQSADANQYEPYYATSFSSTERNMSESQAIFNRGERTTDYAINFDSQQDSFIDGNPQ